MKLSMNLSVSVKRKIIYPEPVATIIDGMSGIWTRVINAVTFFGLSHKRSPTLGMNATFRFPRP